MQVTQGLEGQTAVVCNVGLRLPILPLLVTGARAYECTAPAPVAVRALNARVQVSTKTHGGGTRAVEDIDKIIPPALPFSAPSRPRAVFRDILAERPFGTSLSCLSVPLVLCPFSTHLSGAHLPTASRAKRGWLEGKRICEKDERGWVRGRVETAPADTAVMILF